MSRATAQSLLLTGVSFNRSSPSIVCIRSVCVCVHARPMKRAATTQSSRRIVSRRRFITGVAGATAIANGGAALAQPAGRVQRADRVRAADATPRRCWRLSRSWTAGERGPQACSVYIGDRMINFHRPGRWQGALRRAPAAKPPCGNLCFVCEGTPDSLRTLLDKAGARLVEGPVPRQGGRGKAASSALRPAESGR